MNMQPVTLLPESPVADVTDYLERGGGQGLRRAVSLGPGGTIQEITLSGLRGRGGAGFPTGRKWQSVRDAAASTEEDNDVFVVANGAEGEPGTFKDRAIMRSNPFAVVEGTAIAASAVGAGRAFIGVKESFTHEIDRLARAIEQLTEVGTLADIDVQIVLGPDHYLFGEETGLLQVIEGEPPLPRNVPPYIQGLFATVPTTGWLPSGGVATSFSASNPTLVNNVETLGTVSAVLANGPEWHRSLGTSQSPGTFVATVVGDVRTPSVGQVEMGTPLRDVIDVVGGGPRPGRTVKAVLSGVANPVITAADLDVACSYEGMEEIGTGLGAGGFMVFDDTTSMLEVAHMISRFLYVESCGQCPACKLGCGAATDLLQELLAGTGDENDLDTLAFRLRTCTDGNRCYLPVQERGVILSLLQRFPEEVAVALDGEPAELRDLLLPKIRDMRESVGDAEQQTAVLLDTDQRRKQPDWTYE